MKVGRQQRGRDGVAVRARDSAGQHHGTRRRMGCRMFCVWMYI
jgi:hypothetical protein